MRLVAGFTAETDVTCLRAGMDVDRRADGTAARPRRHKSGDPMATIARLCLMALLAAGGFFAPSAASAQEAGPPLRVATRVVPPMVIDDNGKLSGFSIELWNAIADRMKVKSSFQPYPNVAAALEAVRTGKADTAIAAISITEERDRQFDFSQPMLGAGLQIMVRGGDGAAEASPLRDLLRLLFSSTILTWLGIAAILIVVPAHLIWWLERRDPKGIIAPEEGYIPGIFHAVWWAASTLATQAEQMPRNWISRILAVLWMFTGVVFVAYYTAQLTAQLTVQQIQGIINGPEDLPGKKVATTENSTAAAYLKSSRAQVTEVPRIGDAYEALRARRVDAVVFDAPVLQYFSSHDGKGKVQTVGTIFRREDYGIVFPLDSKLRKRVDRALLGLREDGTYQRLYEKWFAAPAK